MRVVEVESLADFDRLVAGGARSGRGWHVRSVDLTERREALAGLRLQGAVFLGCTLPDPDDVRRRGGLVFPALPDLPFDPYRPALYTPAELYAGLDDGYAATPDARIYAWSHAGRAVDRTLAAALHDHAVDDALEDWLGGRSVVGVMGGHAEERGSAGYRAAARLGHALGATATVATGGGPGAMEAANLGAFLPAGADVDAAVDALAAAPSFAPDVTAWARAGFAVRSGIEGRDTLGVPTWHYGHEPPNLFATAVAKYFTNAVREDVLLRVSRGGIVFLPGAAGTVQEVFQAACDAYYAAPSEKTVLVLVGREHWTSDLPVWPLLSALAATSGMQVHLVDDIDDVDDVSPLLTG